MDWEAERLYVMEMLKENKAGLSEILKSLNEFKLEMTRAVVELKTKVGMYAVIGAAVVSVVTDLTIAVISNYIGK
jgi:hypothetical protein